MWPSVKCIYTSTAYDLPDAKELYSLGKDMASCSSWIEVQRISEARSDAVDKLEKIIDKVFKDSSTKPKIDWLFGIVTTIGNEEHPGFKERSELLADAISSDLDAISRAKSIDGQIAIDAARVFFNKLSSSFELDKVPPPQNLSLKHLDIKTMLERTYFWAAGKVYSEEEIIKAAQNKLARVIDKAILIPGNRTKAKEFLPVIIKAVDNSRNLMGFQENVDVLVYTMHHDLTIISSRRIVSGTIDFASEIINPEQIDSVGDSSARFQADRQAQQLCSYMNIDQNSLKLVQQIYLFATSAM